MTLKELWLHRYANHSFEIYTRVRYRNLTRMLFKYANGMGIEVNLISFLCQYQLWEDNTSKQQINIATKY